MTLVEKAIKKRPETPGDGQSRRFDHSAAPAVVDPWAPYGARCTTARLAGKLVRVSCGGVRCGGVLQAQKQGRRFAIEYLLIACNPEIGRELGRAVSSAPSIASRRLSS